MPKKGAAPDDAFQQVDVAIADPRTLILALGAPEANVCGKAATSLELFAEKSEKNKVELITEGVLIPATELLSHTETAVQASAAVRKSIRDAGDPCTELMMKLLKPEAGAVCQENASGYCANMASEFTGRAALTSAGGVGLLIDLLVAIVPDPTDAKAAPPPPDTARNTLRALGLLCDDYEARALVGTKGGMESIMVLLDSEYAEIQSLALQALASAARHCRNQMIVRVCGGLEKLLHFVANPEYQRAHAQALEVLGVLLADPVNMAFVSERGPADKQNPNGTDAPVAILLGFVEASDNRTREQALRCMARAGGHVANRRLLRDLGAEKAIAARLWSDDPKQPLNPRVALAAIGATTALAQGVSNSAQLGGEGAVSKLVKLLTWADSPECNVAATVALAQITCEVQENCLLLVAADPGLAKVVALFASDNPVCLCSAARVVRNLRVQPKTAGALADLQLCAGLDKCLRSGDDAAQAAAGDALTVLCEGSAFRQQFADHAGSCDALKALLDHSEAVDVRQNAYRAVRACADSAVLAQTLCNIGALHPLGMSTNAFARVAYGQLLNQHLPAKYAFNGDLGLGDIITNGFFDPGALSAHKEFIGLKALQEAPINTGREVLEVNTDTDASLAAFVEELRSSIGDDKGVSAIRAIATAVAARMGAAVPLVDIDTFSHALAISALKTDVGSNVVPLGKVSRGTYYHRTLLFKSVADLLGITSRLIRGEYGRAYNVIYTTEIYVVDVMHDPGRFCLVQDLEELTALPHNFFTFVRAQQ